MLTDARRRPAREALRGRYRSAACFGFPKRLTQTPPADDLRLSVTRLECIAVTARIPPGEGTTGSLIGQPFRARADFARGRYTWCKIVQRPGELSVQRDPGPRLSRACGG